MITVVTVPAPVRFGHAPTVVPAAPPAASPPPSPRPLVALAGSPTPVAAQPGPVAGAGARVAGPLAAPTELLLRQTRDIGEAQTPPAKLTGGYRTLKSSIEWN